MTARKLIETAEEPYRTQMLEVAHPVVLMCEYTRLSSCLSYMFDWEESPQKHKYWEGYETYLIKKGL